MSSYVSCGHHWELWGGSRKELWFIYWFCHEIIYKRRGTDVRFLGKKWRAIAFQDSSEISQRRFRFLFSVVLNGPTLSEPNTKGIVHETGAHL